VVGISWYEANAYCKWLFENWTDLEEGKQGLPKPQGIRLPVENEWVLAAGGEQNERFAFGELGNEEEITRYANTNESRISRTTPVWMYPQGASSPYGIMDMSGNVWEWQANYYDEDHDTPAWRGGSWNYEQVNVRVSERHKSGPNGWNYNLGFRVILVPHPSHSEI
jgi:formylglycine-generating enzyme required for sulfatase activity